MKNSFRAFYAKFCCAFLLAAVFCLLPARAQLYADQPRLYVLKTDYFDIIYPQASRESALILAEHADVMYREIASFFGVEPTARFPVVLTPDTDALNAYFTVAPYNRIVLFDTLPADGSLAVFSDSLLAVFGHELAHAVTANIKSPFWRGMSRVFGDILSPSLILNMVPSFVEGSAVLVESSAGQGRLNNPFVMRSLVQAKLEGKFPSWQEAAGARDIYPSGDVPYLYGGAFARYVYEIYGREKYADLWRRAGRVQFALSAGLFKKTYGISLQKAWNDFAATINVPDAQLPEQAGAQKIAGPAGPLSCLAASADSLVWFDAASSSLYRREKGRAKNEKLLSYANVQRLSFSRDGDFLAVSALEYDGSLYRDAVRLFDVKNRGLWARKIPAVRDACFVRLEDGSNAIAGVSVFSQQASLVVYRENEKIADVHFPRNTLIFSPVDCGGGRLAFILDEGNERFFAVYDLKTGGLKKTKPVLPDHAVFGMPSVTAFSGDGSDSASLMFSWTRPGGLAGFAALTIDFETSVCRTALSYVQLSGGIQYPVFFDGELAYAANFFDRDAVYKMPRPSTESSAAAESLLQPFSPAEGGKTVSAPAAKSVQSDNSPDTEKNAGEKYQPLAYFGKGILVPVAVSGLPALSGLSSGAESLPEYLGLGLTWFTMDPAERYSFLASAGYDFFKKTGLFYAQFNDTSHPVHWGADANFFLDTDLVKLLRSGLNASYTLPLSNSNNYWYFEDQADFLTDFKLWNAVNVFQAYYSTVHKTGSGYFERGGIRLGAGNYLLFGGDYAENYFMKTEFFALAGFELPRLLPFANPAGFTLNLPLGADVRPGISTAGISATVVLFSAEIQRGIPYLPLYVDRFTLAGGYNALFNWHGKALKNVLDATAYVTLSPLVGSATGTHVDLGLRFSYDLHAESWAFSFAGAFRL